MLLLGLEIATSFVIGALLLLGTKKIGFRKIFHPFVESFSSIWDETNGSIFGERFILKLLPSIFLWSSVISWATCKIIGLPMIGTISLLKAVIMGGVIVGAVVAITGFTLLSYHGIIKAIDKIRNAKMPEAEEREKQKILLAESIEKERSRKSRERIEVEYALLVCDGNLSTNMRNLPPEKRTIYLRYKDLKSRICKSFAR